MKPLLLLVLCLAPQDPMTEARKLLDGLAPALKDPPYSQFEWTSGPRTGLCSFERQKAWRSDTKNGNSEMLFLWDGKVVLNYLKKSNRFLTYPKEGSMLLHEGGGLAEIHFGGNAERLLKDAKKATVQKEKLDDVECSHVVVYKPDPLGGADDVELHFWIAEGACKRYTYKYKSNGKPSERIYTYKVVDPPAVTEETFAFKPPPDAKDMRAGNK